MSFPGHYSLRLQLPLLSPGRLLVLDELKGVAILLIVLYHAGGVLLWDNQLHGDLGVDIFVVLSGLGLALSKRQENATGYFKRRLLRLMPLYWLTFAVFAGCGSHFLQKPTTLFDVGLHVLGLHGFFGDQYAFSFNDSFWFISLILFLYVCFWFLKEALTRFDHFLLWTGGVSVVGILVLFFLRQPGMMAHAGYRIPCFFIGMTIGYALRTARLEIPLTLWSAIGAMLYTYVPYTQGIVLYTPFVSLALMAAYSFGLAPYFAEGSAGRKSLRFLGEHSLEIFLLHQPLIREYNFYLHARWFNINTPSALSLIVGMAIGFAFTLFLSVELHKLQRRLLND